MRHFKMDGHYSIKEELKEKDVKRIMTPHLKLITGGSEPPNKTGNWLKDLEIGTVFLVRQAVNPMTGQVSKDFNLHMFRLEGKEGSQQQVICIRSPKSQEEIYVDPIRFCSQFDLHHSIGIMFYPEKNEDVEGNRVSPPGEGEKEDLGKSN